MNLEVTQWVRIVSNRSGAYHPTEQRLLVLGDLVQVIEQNGSTLRFYSPLGSGNNLYLTDAQVWIPAVKEKVIVQSVDAKYTYLTPNRKAPRNPRPLQVGDEVYVHSHVESGATIKLAPSGPKVDLYQRAIYYRDCTGTRRFLWLRNIAPNGLTGMPMTDTAVTTIQRNCGCDMISLMRNGCTCGAITKFQEPNFYD